MNARPPQNTRPPPMSEARDLRALEELDLLPWFDRSAPEALEGLALPEAIFLRRVPPRTRSTTLVGPPLATRMPAQGTMPMSAWAFQLEPELPATGTVIEKYRLEGIIGIGGFAAVYRARHLLLETDVALKLLRPSVVRNRPKLPRLLCEEARFAARIHHPNVVRMLDVTHTDQLTYLVMEFIDGPDLAVMTRRRRRLPAKMVLKIVEHVVAGLAAGLRENLIHRDIKPSNILLTPSGITKIVDFGLARSTFEPSTQVVGTADYMSPEQLDRPAEVDFRSDLYSLGVTAYQALLGRLPTVAGARPEALVAPHVADASIPASISDLVMWLLERDPRARPSSYDALRDAIGACRRVLDPHHQQEQG
jgi:serine/threonine protein kinase